MESDFVEPFGGHFPKCNYKMPPPRPPTLMGGGIYFIFSYLFSLHGLRLHFGFQLFSWQYRKYENMKYDFHLFSIYMVFQLANQKGTKAVSELGQAQTDWQIRLRTISFVLSEVSCFSSLKGFVTADMFLHHKYKRMKAYEHV